MTDNNHPITPPPELVDQWFTEQRGLSEASRLHIATQAARWGADQELEGCVKWLKGEAMTKMWNTVAELASELHASRRPKPPSLKEKASQIVDCLIEGDCLNDDDAITLRQVVESLPS